MQESVPQVPHWLQYGLGLVAAILSGIGIDKLYNSWLNRKKPASEIHLTEATATEIKVRAHSSAGDALTRMMDRLDAAQVTVDGLYETISRLRSERDAWQDEYDKEFTQRKALQQRVDLLVIEADSLKDQMEGAYAYIKFLGRHPTDVDRFRVQLKEGKKEGSA